MTSEPEVRALAGLLLAAGAGRRMGTPKALLRNQTGQSWVGRGAGALLRTGCSPVTVVLGASHAEAEALLESEQLTAQVDLVVAEDWADGLGSSLRAGLERLRRTPPDQVRAAMVMLVDLPDVGIEVMRRVASVWTVQDSPEALLVRATYDGRPGHPVVLGRDHWDPLVESLHGDVGAQSYLSDVDVRRRVEGVECADLATGRDLDQPPGGPR